MTDRQIKEISLIENLQREDLNPIEAATAMKQLMDEYHLTQEELAERIGKIPPRGHQHAAPALPLARGHFPRLGGQTQRRPRPRPHHPARGRPVQTRRGRPSATASPSATSSAACANTSPPPDEIADKKEKKKQQVSLELKDLIERMRHAFKTKVSLIGNDKKGRIYIDYYNTDDLDRISEIVELAEEKDRR